MPKNPVQIHSDLLDQVVKEARASDRRRMNFNFHQLEDPANRMLNAIEPGSYIRPHRHLEPPRDEAFFILRGQGVVVLFKDCLLYTSPSPRDATLSRLPSCA